ncbi:ATP-dependent zinc metalloprotease FTSH 7 [Hibiscus syriacus]|uniref:ATP-dependent zinc metalloprotease FTSH 7 n=1 Tax=Hibiscus syriacus TaxID=106335 RepID=A0A6A2XG17_HIBSY|nr:ATP-dependent zinc metalloprotease FTSH 7 [Hibiscus syriacus]
MSSIEFLRPTTITIQGKFSTNSYSNLLYLHGLNFNSNRFSVLQQKPNFFSNFITSTLKNAAVSGNRERLNLYGRGKLRFKESKNLANCTDNNDSKSSSGETNESEGGQGVRQRQNPTNSGGSTNQRGEKNGRSGLWWSKGKKWQWQPIVQAQEIGVFLLQLGIVMLVMRLLRPGIPLPGSEPRTPSTFVSVPYSDFLNKISANQVQKKLSILPRSGGALGFTYIPPTNEDRYLLFIDELRGRLVTLLGGRAAEEDVYSGRVSTGALDDIRRATDMAYKAVAEYGLNQTIGPLSLATLSGGGMDESGGAVLWGRDQGQLVDLLQREVKALLQSAHEVALSVVRANPTVLEGLGAHLEENEKVEGEELQEWLNLVVAPKELINFVEGKQESLLPVQAVSV